MSKIILKTSRFLKSTFQRIFGGKLGSCILHRVECWVKFSARTRSIPFHFENIDEGHQSHRLVKVPNCVDRFLFRILAICVIFVITPLQWWQLFVYTEDYIKEKAFPEYLLNTVWALGYIAVSCHHFLFLMKSDAIIRTLNHVFSLHGILDNSRLQRQVHRTWHDVDYAVIIMRFLGTAMTISCGISFWMFPNHRRFIFAHLPYAWKILPVQIILGIFETLIIVVQWTGFGTIFFFNILYIETLIICVQGLHRMPPLQALKIYQILRVVSIFYDDAFGCLGLPLQKVAFSLVSLLSMASAIKLFDQLDGFTTSLLFFVALTFLGYNLIILPRAGALQFASTQALKVLRSGCGKKERVFRARIRSFPVLCLKIGWIYPIKPQTTLTYGSTMDSNLMTLLVGLRDCEKLLLLESLIQN